MSDGKSIEKSMIKGAFLLTVSAIIVKILGLIYKIPLSYILSDEGMGYFNTAYTVYTFFYIICTAGVPKSISILISKADSERDYNKGREIYKTALTAFTVIGVIATVILFVFSGLFTNMVGNRGAYLTLLAISPSIAFVCASGVIRGYFNAVLKMLPIAISEIISGLGKLVLGLIFAYIGYMLKMPLYMISALTVLGTSIGAFLGWLFLTIYYKHVKNEHNIKQKKGSLFSFKTLKSILAISLPLTLTSTISALGNILDMGFIMRSLQKNGFTEFQSGVLFGNYSTLALPMLNLVGALIAPISAVILPVVTSLYTKRDNLSLSKNVSSTLNIIGFLTIPISALLFFASYEILNIIFENTSAALAAPLLTLLAPSVIFTSFLTVINTVLEGMEKIRVPLISLIISTLIKICLNFLLIGNENIGMIGAPISASVSSFIGLIISYLYLIKNEKIRVSFVGAFLIPSIISILAILPYIRFVKLSEGYNLFRSVVCMFVFTLVYLMLYTPLLLKYYKKRKIRQNNQKITFLLVNKDEKSKISKKERHFS